jgi:hypothetical protein
LKPIIFIGMGTLVLAYFMLGKSPPTSSKQGPLAASDAKIWGNTPLSIATAAGTPVNPNVQMSQTMLTTRAIPA